MEMFKGIAVFLCMIMLVGCSNEEKTLTCEEHKIENTSTVMIARSKGNKTVYEKSITELYYEENFYDQEDFEEIIAAFIKMHEASDSLEGVNADVEVKGRNLILTFEVDYTVISSDDLETILPGDMKKDRFDAKKRFASIKSMFEPLDGVCTVE